jgi:CIC family chloride channel protein
MLKGTALLSNALLWFRSSPAGLATVAVVIGIGAGLGAIAFRDMIVGFTNLFTGHADYSAVDHASHSMLPMLGMWFVVAAPVVGGLIYGPLVDRWAREARGHGVPEVMYAVAEQGGRIRPRVAIVKSLASALCIGSGGSVGREGPIVQIGSALGSTLGQALRFPVSRLRLMVACGAAGGISATFNTPIAGVFFALELILRDRRSRSTCSTSDWVWLPALPVSGSFASSTASRTFPTNGGGVPSGSALRRAGRYSAGCC